MESRRAFVLVTGQTCITGIPQDHIIQMMEKLKPFANVIFFPCCYLLFIPSRFTALKNSFKGSEIEANNQSILFYQFNWKAVESIKKIPWLFPAPSFPERFHTCRGRNCESAFPSPNFKSCRNHLPGSTYVLSSMRGRKHICWKEMEILKTSWVVIKTLQILLTSFSLWCLTAFPALDSVPCLWDSCHPKRCIPGVWAPLGCGRQAQEVQNNQKMKLWCRNNLSTMTPWMQSTQEL